jgi:hypothetical protein
MADDLVRYRPIQDGDLGHALFCLLHAFADGLRHFMGFPQAGTDRPVTVTNDHDGTESESPASLDNFGRPVNRYHPVDQFYFSNVSVSVSVSVSFIQRSFL